MVRPRIAFIGLGMMGNGMACRLADQGFPLSVFNRTREKASEVEKLGARITDSPADAAQTADVLMVSLADQNVVSSLLWGDDGAMVTLPEGGYVVDMSTVPPDYARTEAARVAESGGHRLDACVLGNPFHARSGELRVMVGGEETDAAALQPIFETIGKEVAYMGPAGMGATMKLVLNMLMGVQMPALAEALVLGEAAGLPREKMLQMISGCGYSSPVMDFRCQIIGQRNFDFAAFKLGLMRKDMMLTLEEAHKLGVPMPVTDASYSSLTAARSLGLGDKDVGAIVAYQERVSGISGYDWPGT
ncbi:MAG TPA: NAD(P)-dependent oxidoreductase [Solirubrobacteraceae bacterium]|nr:NAD(P)-dependent oxidoreductase [Solirubrobacteraceae bacterium]